MIGGIEETSASCEARSAPRSYPTGGGRLPPATRWDGKRSVAEWPKLPRPSSTPPKRASGLGAVTIATIKSVPLGKCKGAGGGVDASIFLHLWIGSGVANHVVRAGSWSRLRLVLRALQTPGNLSGAACSRDLLCLRAADGERPDLQSQWAYSRASHAALRIARNGDEPSERELCYGGDQ
jgi:hypothetical protein